MAILNTIITSSPCEILTFKQASEETGIQCEYLYHLERIDKLDVSFPFPHGTGVNSGQKFIVVNDKYRLVAKEWKEKRKDNPGFNKKKKVKRKKKK